MYHTITSTWVPQSSTRFERLLIRQSKSHWTPLSLWRRHTDKHVAYVVKLLFLGFGLWTTSKFYKICYWKSVKGGRNQKNKKFKKSIASMHVEYDARTSSIVVPEGRAGDMEILKKSELHLNRASIDIQHDATPASSIRPSKKSNRMVSIQWTENHSPSHTS